MTITSNSFEGTSVGASITTTTSVAGGSAVTVYNNGGGVAQYVSSPVMHGTRAAHLSAVSGTGNITGFLPEVAATKYAWRGYCYIPTGTVASGNEVRPLQLVDKNTSQALLVRRTGLLLAVRANGSTDVWSSSSPNTVFPEGQWIRMELLTDVAAGSMTFATYAGDSTTALWSQTMASGWGFAAGATSILRTNFGFVGNSVGDIYWDGLAQNDAATALMGPELDPPVVVANFTDNLARVKASASGGTPPYTFTIDPTGGTTMAAIQVGTGDWVIPKDVSATLNYNVTATDGAGKTSTKLVTVGPIPSGSATSWEVVTPASVVPGNAWG